MRDLQSEIRLSNENKNFRFCEILKNGNCNVEIKNDDDERKHKYLLLSDLCGVQGSLAGQSA